jgi:hypothetical protein
MNMTNNIKGEKISIVWSIDMDYNIAKGKNYEEKT